VPAQLDYLAATPGLAQEQQDAVEIERECPLCQVVGPRIDLPGAQELVIHDEKPGLWRGSAVIPHAPVLLGNPSGDRILRRQDGVERLEVAPAPAFQWVENADVAVAVRQTVIEWAAVVTVRVNEVGKRLRELVEGQRLCLVGQ
jgi:hypothetical protein